ncbi:MAG: ribosomal-processing cysteine protease Prp [Bacilli bacterium]|nr:ribosomal-processing cysteine protease Prp [Bacilli bacterium]
MIKILINYEEKAFQSLEIKGHSNSAPYGEDLICAAVSAVFTGGLNALENVKDFDIQIEEGHSFIKAKGPVSSHDEIVLETMIVGLKTIAEDNGKFIQIKNL